MKKTICNVEKVYIAKKLSIVVVYNEIPNSVTDKNIVYNFIFYRSFM